MYLIKSLSSEHKRSALEFGEIRIGTINYYRSIEDEHRVDGQEGFGSIVWTGQELSAEHHNKIFSPFDSHLLADGWTIKNNGTPIFGSYPNFNAYLFCYSEVNSLEEISATSGGKGEDFYCIADLPSFVRTIRDALMPTMIDLVTEHNPDEHHEALLKHLKILDVTYRINYSYESKNREVNEDNVENFNPKSFHPQDFFQKEEQFAYEKEVRTVWLPVTINPLTGKELPIHIPSEWLHLNLELGELPLSPDLKKIRTTLKTSPVKPKGV